MKVQNVDNIFKEIFKENEGLVKTVDSVYEKSDDGKYLKLVISIHGLTVENTVIIHTKFIFKVDLDKDNLLENAFLYLYDINCIYHSINFNDEFDMEKKIKKIIDRNKFGKDIQILSEFIDTPALLLSHYFNQNNIVDYSVELVNYNPKFKIKPCEETTFDFDISVIHGNDTYTIKLTIQKVKDVDKYYYEFIFKLLDDVKTIKVDKLINVHYIIGHQIVDMLNTLLK